MKFLFFTIIFSPSFILIEAQKILESPQHSNGLQPSVAIIIGVLAMLFFVTILVFCYTRYCYRYLPIHLTPHLELHQFLRSRSNLSGLDESVIDSIPFFTFSSLKGSKQGLQCSICLSAFEKSEVLRLLPKCKHAFHMECIDEWLESHSSCPLCRYKFDSSDFSNFIYTSSLRYNGGDSIRTNFMDSPNLELYVEREEDKSYGSTRFNFGNNFRKLTNSRNGDFLPLEADFRNKFHKFKHKIMVSDIFHKRRWSDLSSSDLILLNSEMLNVVSSKRFNSNNSPKHGPLNEQLSKIKEDMKNKRIFDSRKGKIKHTRSISGSSPTFYASFENEENRTESSREVASSSEKRSMSEITILKRNVDLSSYGNNVRDERIRRLWLPIARQTLQRFAGRENNIDRSAVSIHTSNV